MIDLHPTKCNLCGGPVIYTSNSAVYGREYGSGKCYLCTSCRAYVGTHKPRPREALGLLADARMRKGKMMCHEIFDGLWKCKPKAHKKRRDLYLWLSKRLSIRPEDCHFGYFDLSTLHRAYSVLKQIQGRKLIYNAKGEIVNDLNQCAIEHYGELDRGHRRAGEG